MFGFDILKRLTPEDGEIEDYAPCLKKKRELPYLPPVSPNCAKYCDRKCLQKFNVFPKDIQQELRLRYLGPLQETKQKLVNQFCWQKEIIGNLSKLKLLFNTFIKP